MGRNRFVTPATTRLALSSGDWLEVKKRLSAGERKAVAGSHLGRFAPDGSRIPDWEALAFSGILAYLVDWSLRDAEDKPVAITLAALKNLLEEDFKEIDGAIDAHMEAMDREVAEEKKARGETTAL